MLELKVPVNFVLREDILEKWPEIKSGAITEITDETLSERCDETYDNWVVIPFIYFCRAGLKSTHSVRPVDDAVNIVSGIDFGVRERAVEPFILACRADCHEPKIANYVFEQNNRRAGAKNVSWTPHFPQPNIIKRDPCRGTAVKSLAYMGDISNLYEDFRSDVFRNALAEIGVTLHLGLRAPEDGSPPRMHDYRNIDAVIAVRNLTQEDIKGKPASKLVNAWLAEIPALLGAEPAYQELRKSELDYFEIRSVEDAITAVKQLQSSPALYDSMVENGRKRSKDFTVDCLVAHWVDQLNGPVRTAFLEWRRTPKTGKSIRWVLGIVGEKASKWTALYNRLHGPRPYPAFKST